MGHCVLMSAGLLNSGMLIVTVHVKKTVLLSRPSSGVSTVISNYAAAAQIGAAPGAGSGITQITEEERRRILEEEQRQLDQMKVSRSQVDLCRNHINVVVD